MAQNDIFTVVMKGASLVVNQKEEQNPRFMWVGS